jgi:CDP-diacylglycerol---serine O-phosphatidyltransferase
MSMPFPPFDPEPADSGRKRRTFRGVPIRMLAPNMLTLLALCAGLTSIRMSIELRFDLAIAAIVFAALLDAMDGRVARLLKSTSRFGAELDSLADFVNFGVAPAILLYVWSLDALGSVGWIGSLVFGMCVALRLARFNVEIDNPKRPAWMAGFFVGVPAPAGALVVLLPLYLHLVGLPLMLEATPIVLAYQIAVAFLMVSRLPTFSGKTIGERIPREMVLPVFVAVVIFVALLISFPWEVMATGTLAYLASLPFAYATWHRLEQRHAETSGADDAAPGKDAKTAE